MDDIEDGEMSPFNMQAVCDQMGVLDDVMQARIARLKRKHAEQLFINREYLIDDYQKLLQILANMYQIAGILDCPEHILDVLGDPEGATGEEIDAMLPYTGGA